MLQEKLDTYSEGNMLPLKIAYNIYSKGTIICIAVAKSLQLCPTLCDPVDGSPPGSPVPRILQARTLEWVAISFCNAGKWKVKVKSVSRVRPSATPWTAALQDPPSMGFSRQEYWSGMPLPSPRCKLRVWNSSLSQSNLRRSVWQTVSRSSLRLMSIESVMPSSHLILCRPFFSCPQPLPASESSNESTLRMRWPKY